MKETNKKPNLTALAAEELLKYMPPTRGVMTHGSAMNVLLQNQICQGIEGRELYSLADRALKQLVSSGQAHKVRTGQFQRN